MIASSKDRIRLFTNLDTASSERGCWLWLASTKRGGYGRFDARRMAHRVSYELLVGPIPDGLCVLHECDNPPCCNPAHLFLGTRLDNMQDCAAKGRKWGFKGTAHHRAKLSDADVLAIREAWDSTDKHYGMASRLGRQYGVAHITILRVVKRKNWDHLP